MQRLAGKPSTPPDRSARGRPTCKTGRNGLFLAVKDQLLPFGAQLDSARPGRCGDLRHTMDTAHAAPQMFPFQRGVMHG